MSEFCFRLSGLEVVLLCFSLQTGMFISLLATVMFSFCTLGNKQRESCGKTCQGDRNDEWMGVSLARQDKPNGKILVCSILKQKTSNLSQL